MLSLLILNIFTQLFYTSLASSAFDSKLAFKFYNVAAASYRPDNPQVKKEKMILRAKNAINSLFSSLV